MCMSVMSIAALCFKFHHDIFSFQGYILCVNLASHSVASMCARQIFHTWVP